MNGNIVKIESEETLFKMVSSLIENSRKHIAKTISATTVSTYYEIGHYVVEYEQQGCLRASYGKQVVKNLSDRLTKQYGRGWSVATLQIAESFMWRIRNRMQCIRFLLLLIPYAMHTKFKSSLFRGITTKY